MKSVVVSPELKKVFQKRLPFQGFDKDEVNKNGRATL
jgi:hypothetical protein